MDIPCPVPACVCFLKTEDVDHLPEYMLWLDEADRIVQLRATYKKCALHELMGCSPEEGEPREKFLSLECGMHFYHRECLGAQLRFSLDECMRKLESLGCPQCVKDKHLCTCYYCNPPDDDNYDGNDANHPHFIQLHEADELIGESTFTEQDKSRLERLQVLIGVKDSGGRIFHCKCGEAYEIGQHEQVFQCRSCPYKACLKVI